MIDKGESFPLPISIFIPLCFLPIYTIPSLYHQPTILGTRKQNTLKMAILTTLLTISPLLSTLVLAEPPNIPTASTAKDLLSNLTVAPQGPQDGYDRDLFPHWIDIEGECNTRETVLNRDGTDLDIGSDCYPESGKWESLYDGESWTQASDLDIDHVVPLSNAWKSGAADWTTDQRQALANDLDNPQLIAVTDNVRLPPPCQHLLLSRFLS